MRTRGSGQPRSLRGWWLDRATRTRTQRVRTHPAASVDPPHDRVYATGCTWQLRKWRRAPRLLGAGRGVWKGSVRSWGEQRLLALTRLVSAPGV